MLKYKKSNKLHILFINAGNISYLSTIEIHEAMQSFILFDLLWLSLMSFSFGH